jgi:tetratricopeptide (TPR) repeat protein
MMDDGDDLRRATRLKGTKSTNAPPITATNSVTTATTNSVTNLTSATKPPAVTEDPEEAPATHAGRRVGRSYFRIVGNTVGLAAALVVLGFVAAQDFGHLLKFRLGKELSYVDARSERNSTYERAEHLALKGDHHGAIRLLQAILNKHPGHIHSAVRIAELYDKELQDFPRAALHYEEALKLNIPPEQWGWIAIRLANIYSGKLAQPHVALSLIQRLATEHPETPAGAKALKRLAKIANAGLLDNALLEE